MEFSDTKSKSGPFTQTSKKEELLIVIYAN